MQTASTVLISFSFISLVEIQAGSIPNQLQASMRRPTLVKPDSMGRSDLRNSSSERVVPGNVSYQNQCRR
jgi:hypothetical protein